MYCWSKPTILLASQDERERGVTALILRQAGYEVREAATGREAIRLAVEGAQTVILDANLPDINALEVHRKMKANPRTAGIPIVYLSAGDGAASHRSAVFDEGAEACLPQPTDPLDLLVVIRTCVRLKAAEEALRLHDPSYYALLESVPDAMFHINPDGALVDGNASGCRMLGYLPEEIPALSAYDIVAPEDAARVLSELALLRAGEVVHSEWLLCRKDGTRLRGEVDATARRDGLLICIVRDVTRLRDLQDVRQELTEAQRMARVGSWEWTPATGAIHWSEGVKLIVRRSLELPAPPTFETLSASYTREGWKKLNVAAVEIIATGAPAELELEMIRDDGTTCWTTLRGEAVRAPDGSIRAIRGTVHDIDDRKRAEMAARQEEAFTQTIIDSLPGLFYVIGEDGRPVRWNESLVDISGYSSAEIPRMSVLDFFRGPDKSLVAERMNQVFTLGKSQVEGSLVSIDGTETPYLFHGKRVMFGATPHVVGIGIDITERKRTEDALRISERRYRDLFDSTVDAMIIIDPSSGRFVSANPGAIGLFRTKNEEELVAQGLSEYSPERQPDGLASPEKAREMLENGGAQGLSPFRVDAQAGRRRRISGRCPPYTSDTSGRKARLCDDPRCHRAEAGRSPDHPHGPL